MATLTAYVTASENDGYQTGAIPGGTPNLTSTICNANATTHFGAHLVYLGDVEQGATINSAYFEVYITSGSFDDPDHTIHFENTISPNFLSTATDNISNRSRTTGVLWDANGIGGSAYKTGPDMAADLQGLVNDAGWGASSRLVNIITVGKATGNSRWNQYDGGNAPRLVVDYTNPSAGGSLPPMRRTRTYLRL